jgi:hypothetical protein
VHDLIKSTILVDAPDARVHTYLPANYGERSPRIMFGLPERTSLASLLQVDQSIHSAEEKYAYVDRPARFLPEKKRRKLCI